MKLAVIIPTLLTSPQLLIKCLNSLSAQSLSQDQFEVFLVSNVGILKLKTFMTQMTGLKFKYTILGSDHNFGFTGATNTGIVMAMKQKLLQYLVTLNDDVWLEPEFLSELIKTQQQTQSDMVASLIYQGDSDQTDSCGIDFAWRGKAWPLLWQEKKWVSPLLNLPDNWLKSPEFLTHLPDHNFRQPFGPDAAAALYTKQLFDQVGLFDNRFFAYLEDVDLALRARKMGLTCSWASRARAHHVKHATARQMGKFKQKRDLINWWRIVGKYDKPVWLKFWPQILLERGRNLSGLIKI